MYRNLGAGTRRNLNHARINVARTSHQFQEQLVGSHSGGEWLSREVHRFRPLAALPTRSRTPRRGPSCSAIGTTGRVLLARWSFHTPRQQAGQASASEPPE